jgi:hypothetical protein
MSNIEGICPESVNHRIHFHQNRHSLCTRMFLSILRQSPSSQNATFLRLSPTDGTCTHVFHCVHILRSHDLLFRKWQRRRGHTTTRLSFSIQQQVTHYPIPQFDPRCVFLVSFGLIDPMVFITSPSLVLSYLGSIHLYLRRVSPRLNLSYYVFLWLHVESKLHIWGHWEARQHWFGN